MEYLLKDDVILINRKTIERHGGNFIPPFNFLHEAPLDYLIEAISAKMFGEELYPSISDKAGLLMFNIISNHVFQDGNKRTGLGSALLFLRLNDYELSNQLIRFGLLEFEVMVDDSNEKILIDFTLQVASGKISLVEVQGWFKKNIVNKNLIIPP